MCGITGFIDWSHSSSGRVLEKMNDVLSHRGPDGHGVEIFNTEIAQVGMAHRRLSIIDLSDRGRQPMFTEDKKYCILLNGEIYNYKEIKSLLIADGDKFCSDTDTEVVLKACRKWGEKAVDKFIGMFVFVIYDQKEHTLTFYRDRAGVKPLYYYWDQNIFLFSSELKSFHEHPSFKKVINKDAVSLFFRHGYIDSPHSIFENCYKLEPGHILKVELSKKEISFKKYWDCYDYYNAPKLQISYEDALSELDRLFHSAFNYRMIADVPVGVFLSSGYDSSTVAAILSQSNLINTYTIGFDGSRFDESENAKKIADYLKTNHHTLHANEENIPEIIKDLAFYYDEPFGDSSAIPSIMVSKLAKRNVTVALSADGGDELFAGYPKHYQHFNSYKFFSQIPYAFRFPFRTLGNLDRFKHREGLFNAKNTNDILKSKLETIIFTNEELKNLLSYNFNNVKTKFDSFEELNQNNGYLDKLLAVDYKTYLQNDILVKMDRASMSASLESREPLLDHRILEFAAKLPEKYKFDGITPKKILKDINRNYIPSQLMHNKKMGFGGPVKSWLHNVMHHDFEKLFKSSHFPVDILDYEYTKDFVFNRFYNHNSKIWWYKIYQIYIFLKWYEKWS